MINIKDFCADHVERAQRMALKSYHAERRNTLALPAIDSVPSLAVFAGNGLGVAAFEGDEMVGFLCSVAPFENAFRSTSATGVFSPMHANGATFQNRDQIYGLMYQAAGEKWAKAGASSHVVCLYAHDRKAQAQFFRYGFGLRCVDAVRGMEEIDMPTCGDYEVLELRENEILQVLPLDHMLDAHMAQSPTFILRPSETEETFLESARRAGSRYFAGMENGKVIAFLRVEREGGTFLCDAPGYMHITGAFCLPEHRGKGVHQSLLGLLIKTLKAKGYTCLGVDFESINPAAHGFWLKHFTAYTHGVVRRIDEYAITKR